MKVYHLAGVHVEGEEWMSHMPPVLFFTRAAAEKQMAKEIAEYNYDGHCEWFFGINEIEVRE